MSAGPQHVPTGQLDFRFLQLISLAVSENELHQQADHIENAAASGRQAGLSLLFQQLVMASQQRNQRQQQQA